MGGLSIGIFWGTLASVVGLAALSLSSPLPPRGGADAMDAAPAAPDAEAVEAVAEEGAAEGAAEEAALAEAARDADPVPSEGAGEGGDDAAPAESAADDEAATPAAADDEAATPAAGDEEGGTVAPATEIPLPSGSEFNRPPPEPEAALPAPDAAPVATAPQAPSLSGDVTAPSLDTAPAAQPLVVADAPAQIAAVTGDASVPASPAASAAPVVASGPTALSQPETSAAPQVSPTLVPQVAEAAQNGATDPVDVAAAADPEPAQDPVVVPLQTPVFPTIGDGAAPAPVTPEMPTDAATDGEAAAGAPEVAALSTPAFPQTSGLPQVVPDVPDAAVPVAAEEEAVPAEVAVDDLPAIQAFAAPFDTAEERALMSVILIDDPDSNVAQETLTRFTFPVAFAIAPDTPDAAERAAAYREAGFEVVMLGSMIPPGATAADVETVLAEAASTLPEAVAVLDVPEGRIQGDRPVLDAIVTALTETGHGLVAFPRGLNAAEQSATRAGVPAATVFRLLDNEGQRATEITRYLSRAAFAAVQEGNVIVVGRTRPDTVTALFSWALGGRSEGVALAPLSATLLRASGP